MAVVGDRNDAPDFLVTPAATALVSGSNITFSPTATTTYTVTALYSSSAGCPSPGTTITINVSAPAFTYTQTNAGCFGGSTGSITVNATGGVGTYEYSKNGGGAWQTSNVFSGLTAVGSPYSVMVRDVASGTVTCTSAAQPVTITEPAAALALTATGTDVTCNGASNGAILATASNGTANYQYSIDGVTFLPVVPTAGSRNFTGLL